MDFLYAGLNRRRERNFEEYEYVEYLEEGGGTSNGQLDKTDLVIRMTDRDAVSMPSDSFLQVRFQIVAENGSTINGGKIAPVNNGWNLFKRARYSLSDGDVEDIYRCGYVAQVKGLIEYSDDYERGQGQLELWMPDRLSEEPVRLSVVNRDNPLVVIPDITLATGASPHIITLTSTVAFTANEAIDFYYKGERVQFINRTTGAPTQLLAISDVVVTQLKSDPVTANGQILDPYVAGKKLNLFHSNGILGSFIANAIPALTWVDGQTYTATEDGLFESVLVDRDVGFEARYRKGVSTGSTMGREYNLWLPLRRLFPLLKQNPVPMKGITQELKLDLNDMAKILFKDPISPPTVNGAGAGNCKVKLDRLSWWVPLLKPELTIMNEFNKFLNSGQTRTLMWDAVNHYETLRQGSEVESSWLIKTTEHRPVRCFIFFQLDSRYSSQNTNNMVFDNLDLKNIYLTVNSDRQFPRKEYRINYESSTAEDFSRVYSMYLNACGCIHSDDCLPAINYDEFKELYPLYFFDLEHQDDTVWENTTQAHVTVNYRLGANVQALVGGVATDIPFRIHAILETERQIILEGANSSLIKIK